MFGAGDTRLAALEDLRKKFDQSKAAKKELPRPGTKIPVQFAATTRVDRHADLARDFITRVRGLEWAFISDESSLGGFHAEEANGALVQRIHDIYGVDVADVSNGNLADIFDRIAGKANSRTL